MPNCLVSPPEYLFNILYVGVGLPPLIFTCIGFNVTKTSKEKQKVILQLTHREDNLVMVGFVPWNSCL